MISKTEIISIPKAKCVVGIGDTHFPFSDKHKLRETIEVIRCSQPDVVIQVGDLYDSYMFSRFARSVNVTTPAEELSAGRTDAEEFWKSVHKAAPNASCYQLIGNHSTTRIIKFMLNRAPELESLLEKPLDELMTFKGVTTARDHRSEIHSPDWVAIHGWSCKPMFHATYFNKSVICGHVHKGSVTYRAGREKPIWEMNCGHVADVNALPLQYGETTTTNWVSGVGVVDKWGPRFIAL